jgi:hypothetical protein
MHMLHAMQLQLRRLLNVALSHETQRAQTIRPPFGHPFGSRLQNLIMCCDFSSSSSNTHKLVMYI